MKQTTLEELYNIYLEHSILSKDTRQIEKGCIYLALKGDSFDGNQFAEQAIEKGAAFAIIDDVTYAKNEKYLLVEHVLSTLQQLANHHRKQLSIPILAISGSNGKTTTKELIAAALAPKFNVLYTNGNYNNHIGVPLTLLRIKKEHEIAIIEMGANHQKEINFLCEIAEPDYGMLTNIGKAHLEGFGGEDGVRKGKTEMFHFIEKNGGKLFINLDDLKIKAYISDIETITYSLHEKANCQGLLETSHTNLQGTWVAGNHSGTINSSLYGAYNFQNILAACCIANYFKVPASDIDKAINAYQSDMNRSQTVQRSNYTALLDAYNANPSSMKLALENFEQSTKENKTAILGDMFELGTAADEEHKAILEQLINSHTITQKILVGKNFFEHQLDYKEFKFFKTTQETQEWFVTQNWEEKTILLKGSRGMRLEDVLNNE